MAGIGINLNPDGTFYAGDDRGETEAEAREYAEGEYELIAFIPYGDGEDRLMRMFEDIMALTYDVHPRQGGHVIDRFLLKIFEAGREFGKNEK